MILFHVRRITIPATHHFLWVTAARLPPLSARTDPAWRVTAYSYAQRLLII